MSAPVTFLDGRVTLYPGDCREVIAGLPDASVDSVVTDPPYHLTSMAKPRPDLEGKNNQFARRQAQMTGFMGKDWDGGDIAFQPELWADILRVLKPGGHMVAFSGTRTYHRMVCAIEDAGFEIRDQLAWVFGSGFPKSHNVAVGIAKSLDPDWETGIPMPPEAEKWAGFGTAAKPAWEPICLARKPLIGTVAANVLAYGTGAINIDACRVGTDENLSGGQYSGTERSEANCYGKHRNLTPEQYNRPSGRWPANLIHDGSEEVLAGFPETNSGGGDKGNKSPDAQWGGLHTNEWSSANHKPNSGTAARFFYSAKADAQDRVGSFHPTIKPVDLMRWLCRLITPPGGTILDPFAGTGTTGEAAFYEGFSAILIEREAEYQADIERRMRLVMAGPDERDRESAKARMNGKPVDHGPLFAWGAS